MGKEKDAPKPDGKEEATKDGEKKPEEEDSTMELSEEDQQLKDELRMLVERLQESDLDLHGPALESLRTQIRSSTSTMTSVPKPMKFLREHYATLKGIFDKWTDGTNRRFLADVVSVLAMVNIEGRECLEYRLKGSKEPLETWGHEYVRHLAGEIGQEYTERFTSEEDSMEDMTDSSRVDELILLVKEIIPYNMAHNAEAEACDLLMEIDHLDLLEEHVDETSYPRVCLYLTSCVSYVPEPEDSVLLKSALNLYRKFNRSAEALLLAIRLHDTDLIKDIFMSCEDQTVQKQLAYILGRQQISLPFEVEIDNAEVLTEIMQNVQLNNSFLTLARELDIMEPKVPEDVYKSHLEPQRHSYGPSVDSAKQNLASSFVNGFLNCGFGKDKLLSEPESKWIYKNKDEGMLSATASLGLVLLWDVDSGLSEIDKYLYSTDEPVMAGGLLACGIVNSGVRNDCDPALAILSDYVTNKKMLLRAGAIMGLGLAYAGSERQDVIDLLIPALTDEKSNMECVGLCAVSLGLIALGTCHPLVTETILQVMMEKSEADLKDPCAKFLALGLGLTFLGKQEAVEATVAALGIVAEPLGKMASVLVEVCAYAGTGNVLKVQNLLHICSEHYDTDKDKDKEKEKTPGSGPKTSGGSEKEKEKPAVDSSHQAAAVLGIALISMGEEIGCQMAMRSFAHLLHYGEPAIRRAVPLALGLLSASNPQLPVLDTLSKLSHDTDAEVAYNAILAMGLVGGGTNNARLAGMLRQLAMYYHKDANSLFVTRVAQGLVHAGKGTLTLNPYQADRTLLFPVGLGGLLSVLVSCLDIRHFLLGKCHYVLYFLAPAIQPRMLVTLDEDLNPLSVNVRVGQAVDIVGQAGKPKTITGFQTHSTPVLLGYGERAELATDEYTALTPVLEGFVVLKKEKSD
eukprot:m.11543 g.11543  ORF g.11543 m.11543 type:complete len:911 (+) comp23495_c0_seq1:476-3208(+)